MEMEDFDWSYDILGDANATERRIIKDGFQVNNEEIGNGYGSSFSLVLDRERGELVEAPARMMDKASLLGEVIRHLKDLKRNAAQACEGLIIPNDNDEISVEEQEGGVNGFPYSIKASLCCEYQPGLLSNIRQALDALHLIIMKADIATFGGRMKNVFVVISCEEHNFDAAEYRQFLAGSVHQALKSVLNRFSVSQDMLGARKRRRVSIFSSSSLEDFL
ncbi:hypothetical protein TSUD_93370 [Trifolium subterraneum]|uniref:ACT domain-containing protein n=1 Tax=Trifolium subterraneum TaxID=3900 RepID=A0A2Z6MUG8_TRISU|nr:hypothetical protein TSUD_93370 [Trifolium subterraneum]